MSERIGLLLSVLVFCAPSCIGTETDNPVAGFEPTACKNKGGSALRLPDSHAHERSAHAR